MIEHRSARDIPRNTLRKLSELKLISQYYCNRRHVVQTTTILTIYSKLKQIKLKQLLVQSSFSCNFPFRYLIINAPTCEEVNNNCELSFKICT